MREAFQIRETSDGVRVLTHCVYPSGACVNIVIRGGEDTFVVSDEGGALREIEAAGAEIENPDRILKRRVAEHGFNIANGIISSPKVGAKSIALAVALLANVSRDSADWLFVHTKIPRPANFKAMLKQLLETRFIDRVREETLVGQSNKPHKFEHLVHLPDGRRVIVDPVLHDASSINSRVVAHMDVRMASYDKLEQRIVYDDAEEWTPEDLNLLQAGAPIIVPFSKAPNVLARMANAAT